MNLGAEPRKVAILGVLGVVAAVVLYMNVFSGSSDAPVSAPPRATAVATSAPPTNSAPIPAPQRRTAVANSVGEFKPRQGAARPEDRPDPANVDPALRLDLLAKVQAVEPGSALRNVFQYGAAPPPPKPIELPKNVPKIPINQAPPPATAPPPPSGPPPAPTAPPMTFKYYGFRVSKVSGRKEAFLLDGEDIIIAGENEGVKRGRYRVVRINATSITIEDTQFRSQQTLQLEEGIPG